ncbi:MAG: deoxyribose-phosphate aldolase [Bacteroidales bacterium]|jgi:deoxyribose-phosphate aldolase|nr:deoxyribose-phosphate aldolase [Bacteroidales bacterium]MCI2122123.1 deoxyribose-phosphate aldolase [Bacteroidales bacterium]MCI2145634.1 deoxyribose-phosphate aldolase [Bacteroidales bacterium]
MELTEKYGYRPDASEIEAFVENIKTDIRKWENAETYRRCLGLVDLTSLHVTDTPEGIEAMVAKVNNFKAHYPDLELPASICIYPNFAKVAVKARKARKVDITCVGGCFPSSQSFQDVKILECRHAVEDGADEIDIVLAQNAFLGGNYDRATEEIIGIGDAIREINDKVILKVILETGTLNYGQIAEASFLAIEAGADFIKTSTGKTEPAATPEAAAIMCNCINAYHEKSGRKIGFKPAGGIASAEDAALYYGIVDTILGKEWLDPSLFRFGASRMANNLISAIRGCNVTYY